MFVARFVSSCNKSLESVTEKSVSMPQKSAANVSPQGEASLMLLTLRSSKSCQVLSQASSRNVSEVIKNV